MKGIIGVGLLALALAGCGSGEQGAAPPPTPTTATPAATPTSSAPPGPSAFIEWARSSEMGDRDMTQATDEQLLDVGNKGCALIGAAPTYGVAVADLGQALKQMNATNPQIEEMLRRSVVNLCPQYAGKLP